jgi:hypothetical protein
MPVGICQEETLSIKHANLQDFRNLQGLKNITPLHTTFAKRFVQQL